MPSVARLHSRVTMLAILLVLVVLPFQAAAAADPEAPEDHKNLAEALKDGDYGITLRYRYDFAANDIFDDDSQASTLRTTAWYRSAGFYRFSAFVDFEDVTNLGLDDDHNDTQNGVTGRPIIADPPGTDVNQATLSYGGLPGTELEVGRREINLDDQRFIGAVGWRQNHQSYDSFFLTQQSIPRTKLTYSYLNNVKSVVGVNRSIDGHLLNVNVDVGRLGTAVGYYYDLDFTSAALAALSTRTIGASWQGEAKLGGFGLPFRLELAQQDDIADNPNVVDAGYLKAELGFTRKKLKVWLGYELLEGSAVDGRFTTPLATLHKFNGWADRFLLTPANGLEDIYLAGSYGWGRFKALLVLHSFEADSGGATYGDEIDGRLVYTAPWKQTFAIKFALFDGDLLSDSEAAWVYTGYRF